MLVGEPVGPFVDFRHFLSHRTEDGADMRAVVVTVMDRLRDQEVARMREIALLVVKRWIVVVDVIEDLFPLLVCASN